MKDLKCNSCGGQLHKIETEENTYICLHCGSKQILEENIVSNTYNVTNNIVNNIYGEINVNGPKKIKLEKKNELDIKQEIDNIEGLIKLREYSSAYRNLMRLSKKYTANYQIWWLLSKVCLLVDIESWSNRSECYIDCEQESNYYEKAKLLANESELVKINDEHKSLVEKLESIKENSMHTENSIQSYSEQILGKMTSLRDLVSQSDEAIINYQKKLLEEHQSISGEVDLLRKELLETNENRFGAINEWNHSFELQIKTVDERICAELINIVSMIEQRGVMLKQYNMQMQDSHKELIGCFDVVSGKMENQKLHFEELAQSSVKNNDACMKKHSDKILGGLDSVQKMQKFIMFLLVVIIALAGILIFK